MKRAFIIIFTAFVIATIIVVFESLFPEDVTSATKNFFETFRILK